MWMMFRSADERYRWLNDVVAIVEAACYAAEEGSGDTERWTLRAFECVNDLASDPTGTRYGSKSGMDESA
jgi:hypothetical protein